MVLILAWSPKPWCVSTRGSAKDETLIMAGSPLAVCDCARAKIAWLCMQSPRAHPSLAFLVLGVLGFGMKGGPKPQYTVRVLGVHLSPHFARYTHAAQIAEIYYVQSTGDAIGMARNQLLGYDQVTVRTRPQPARSFPSD